MACGSIYVSITEVFVTITLADILGSITPLTPTATSLAESSSTSSVPGAPITMRFEGWQWPENAILAYATCARAAWACGSQKVISMARYRSMAAESSARASSC
jgi:hypothetical protein